jgi:hypothetical protein
MPSRRRLRLWPRTVAALQRFDRSKETNHSALHPWTALLGTEETRHPNGKWPFVPRRDRRAWGWFTRATCGRRRPSQCSRAQWTTPEARSRRRRPRRGWGHTASLVPWCSLERLDLKGARRRATLRRTLGQSTRGNRRLLCGSTIWGDKQDDAPRILRVGRRACYARRRPIAFYPRATNVLSDRGFRWV